MMSPSSTLLRRILALASLLFALVPATLAQDLFWEKPRALVDGEARFPALIQLDDGPVAIWQEAEGGGQARDGSAAEGRIWLSLARWTKGDWELKRRFAGPFAFRGAEPSIFTATGEAARLAVAAAKGDGQIEVLVSQDGGETFRSRDSSAPSSAAVAPRIFLSGTDDYILFATQGATGAEGSTVALSLAWSTSADGLDWAPFQTFEPNLKLSFLPVVAHERGSRTDLAVFQSLVAAPSGGSSSYQLFSSLSQDGGKTWSTATRITDFQEPVGEARNGPGDFDNERPVLARIGDKVWLAWERNPLGSPAAIYITSLDQNGLASKKDTDRVSKGSGTCQAPSLMELGGKPVVTWFDNRRGTNRVYMARLSGIDWQENDLSGDSGESYFGAMARAGSRPFALWESNAGGRYRVYLLEPDTTVAPPTLAALDFKAGQRSRRSSVSVRVDVPEDSSGIQGYSWAWSRDPQVQPPHELMALPAQRSVTEQAAEDGPWYLAVAVLDYAGNWSVPARIGYERDTTPPPPPLIIPADLDASGFLSSNSFRLEWVTPEDGGGKPVADIAGYTWELRYVGGLEPAGRALLKAAAAALRGGKTGGQPAIPGLSPYEAGLVEASGTPLPPPVLLGTKPEVSYRNIDNGYWLFSVASIDSVGNIGDTSAIFLRANKYQPYTAVLLAESRRDDFGTTAIRILGKGFSAGGLIDRIVLDRDGREPWDLDRSRLANGFRVVSDQEIDGLSFDDLPAGVYRIGLHHPARGWYWTGPYLSIDVSGTVKYVTLAPGYDVGWKFTEGRAHRLSVYDLIVILAALFFAVAIVFLSRQVATTVRDAEAIRAEVLALVSGGSMPSQENAAKAQRLKRRGSGLRLKLTLTIGSLVVFVVFLVSILLGYYMTKTESQSLATGLEQRALVLLESVAQGGRSYLPNAENQLVELGALPKQAQAMEDAIYITVTGYGVEGKSTDPDVVYATNDPDILSKIDTPTYQQGSSSLRDSLSESLPSIISKINADANSGVGQIATSLATLNAEGRSLAANPSPQAQARLAEIGATSRSYENNISETLFALANKYWGSLPGFEAQAAANKSGRYLFYKPILYRQGQDGVYYRGMVRLEVSTEKITAAVKAAYKSLLTLALSVAALALALGIVGAFFLSRVIVIPISKLVDAVKTIRDTEDKENLADLRIEVDTKDEIDTLAVTIKEMSDGLVQAAKASKELIVGKGIQKMFIPLDPAPGSKAKLSTGRHEDKAFEVFGYYEGAKGVSGDYWDFAQINPRYYYFIKCDISGKGVSAALIMVQVATMVINYFNGWKDKTDEKTGKIKKGMPEKIDLTEITYQINDFIAERRFVGRFAAFTLGVWDADTGTAYLCEAGDRKLHVWDARRGELVEEILPDSPAAGPLESFMIRDRTPFVQVTRRLQKDDVLFLYTDGIEEAKRHFRDGTFEVKACDYEIDPWAFLASFIAERLKLAAPAEGQAGDASAWAFLDRTAAAAFAGRLSPALAACVTKRSTDAVVKAAVDETAKRTIEALFARPGKEGKEPPRRKKSEEAVAEFNERFGREGSHLLKTAFEEALAGLERHVAVAFITKPAEDFLGEPLREAAVSAMAGLPGKLAEYAAGRIERTSPGMPRPRMAEAIRSVIAPAIEPHLEGNAGRLASKLGPQLQAMPATAFRSDPVRSHLKKLIEAAPADSGEKLLAALAAATGSGNADAGAAFGRVADGAGLAAMAEDFSKIAVPHGNHNVGEDNEEFGYDRITAVLEAVDQKGSYRLEKYHDPVKDDMLTFDFSSCTGSLEEKVMALIAVEKVFRMYPDPAATANDVVLVDEKVNSFLEEHFDQYRLYCSDHRPNFDPQNENPGYLLYGGIKEDGQYDDLTILAIRRK
jgi:HAMP domain-containing protein